MKLHELVPNPGSKKKRKRVGRGISAGQGKTAGRGTKGQGARSGEGGRIYRQGGNLPFYRRLPFMRGEGFTPLDRIVFNVVNLDQLAGIFKADGEVTPETLSAAHLLRDVANPVKVLGRGELKVPLKVRVHRISAAAKAKIEAAGGSVEAIRQGAVEGDPS
jgi:large subunit ribosomal protein L15